jgi:splicing factor 1
VANAHSEYSTLAKLLQARLRTTSPANITTTTSIASPTTTTMSWRNQGITGSNNIPLGKSRRFGGTADSDGGSTPQRGDREASQSALSDRDHDRERELKRGRSPERAPAEPLLNEDGSRRRKRRNRWGDASDNKAANLMNLATAVTATMTSEQLEAYTVHLRIEEITQKLKIDDVVPADGDRSLSPAPQYDNHGRRINTREFRYRKKLEDERHKLIEKAVKIIPNYHPPSDYRRPTKTQEKVYVPVNDYPEINFSTSTLTLLTVLSCPSPFPPSPLSAAWLDPPGAGRTRGALVCA